MSNKIVAYDPETNLFMGMTHSGPNIVWKPWVETVHSINLEYFLLYFNDGDTMYLTILEGEEEDIVERVMLVPVEVDEEFNFCKKLLFDEAYKWR